VAVSIVDDDADGEVSGGDGVSLGGGEAGDDDPPLGILHMEAGAVLRGTGADPDSLGM
jgi:hypothetical protein